MPNTPQITYFLSFPYICQNNHQMKIQITLLLCLSAFTLVAQDYLERAKHNLPYLIRDKVLHRQIQINEQGVTMFASAEDSLNNKPEATIYWDEVNTFLNMLDGFTVDEAVARYLAKGTAPFPTSQYEAQRPKRVVPNSLKGMRIALDPGHNANRTENAVIERKFMRIKGEDLGLDNDVSFFESDLTFETAAILRKRLKRAGAKVLITRKRGKSAAGPTFDKWLKSVMKRQLKRDQKSGKLTSDQVEWHKKASVNEKFRYYFNRNDLRTRADKINAFQPDITLIIHYNASGANMVDGYYKPTETNYSMAFVGGGFMKNELNKPIDRLHFLRILLSEDFEHSVNLSKVFMEQHIEVLKVPAIVPQNSVFYLTKNSVYTGTLGVYARNLFLTRHVKGPLVFGESFLQDSKEEALRLYLEDYKEKCIKTSSRIGEAVDAYYETVLQYVEQFGKQ